MSAKKFSVSDFLTKKKLDGAELIIVGIVGLKPLMKDEVPSVLFAALQAGVQIRATTGDSKETICALGIQSGLISNEELDDPYVCMTGKELEEACTLENDKPQILAEERLAQRKKEVVKKLQILARTSPKYNKLLIEILKEENRIVAATGS